MYYMNEYTSLMMSKDDHSLEKLVPLVIEPRNRPGKSKDSKETTATVIKINFPINRYTSKYPLTQRAIVYWQFSKILNGRCTHKCPLTLKLEVLF